jgi:hypothetical protein
MIKLLFYMMCNEYLVKFYMFYMMCRLLLSFCLDTWGLLERLVYLVFDEELVGELADLPLTILNLGRFNISFTPCVV